MYFELNLFTTKGYYINILVFSPVRLTPKLDAGSRKRIYNIAKYLQNNGHKIHFVYYANNGIDYDSFQFMQDTWDTFTVIEQKTNIQRRTGNYELDEWYEESISKTVNKLVSLFQIDIVWTNYIFQSKFLEFLPEYVYKIIDTHDVFTDRYKLFENIQETVYTWYSYSKEDEARGISRADLVIAITEKEKKYFERIVDTKVVVVGHLEQTYFLDKEYKSLKKVGFIGGANDVNIVSINNFLEEFYQKSKFKDQLQIVVAGWVCDSIKMEHDNLQLLGMVENVKDFYSEIDIVINPLTLGTGQKIKSVEALSYGIPIVSTSIGWEGIESQEKYHQIKNITEMIKIIDTITQTPELLNDLAKSSKKIFKQYKNNMEKKIENVFSACKIIDARPEKDSIQIQRYRQKMKQEFDELIVRSQEKLIEEKTAHILKQSDWIKKQEKRIEEKTTLILKQSVWIKEQEKRIEEKTNDLDKLPLILQELASMSFFKHPIKKIQKYKYLMKEYHKLKRNAQL